MKKFTINAMEWRAICSLCDLAMDAVSDAEHDHMEYKKTSRRNGGYSSDARIFKKLQLKIYKQRVKQDEEK